ncbi:MAG: CoB--CoM heterodisulfide reductase iron-sulfur subunit B family protein [Bacillota bacterium]|nr:CoB--CoM heterodisulfide reductase iron-sulfur subunit B family protein [Bacillota bacterium]
MKYAYYPGCSLEATAREYDASTRAALGALGVEAEELHGWNCCGASSGHSYDHLLSLALPARVLALAEEQGQDVIVPCAACFNRLAVARREIGADAKVRANVEAVVGRPLTGQSKVLSPLTVIERALAALPLGWQPPRPLAGLRLAPYYGCLLARPPEATGFGHPEFPAALETILGRLGATPVSWSSHTDCCGGNLSLTRGDLVRTMVGRIADAAGEAGAMALVTACPLCQTNIEMRQPRGTRLPSFYFSELVALALDLPGLGGWLRKHLIDPAPLLRSLGLVA